MERAGKTIAKLRSLPGIEAPELAFAAWTVAIGERLAARAMPAALVRGKLIVDVEDKVWQQQLYQLCGPIMGKLTGLLGPGIVNELEFRVRAPKVKIPRRPPQRATAPDAARDPEADGIADPVMRMLYRGAKRRAR